MSYEYAVIYINISGERAGLIIFADTEAQAREFVRQTTGGKIISAKRVVPCPVKEKP